MPADTAFLLPAIAAAPQHGMPALAAATVRSLFSGSSIGIFGRRAFRFRWPGQSIEAPAVFVPDARPPDLQIRSLRHHPDKIAGPAPAGARPVPDAVPARPDGRPPDPRASRDRS